MRVHFAGIGGSGMRPLAALAMAEGWTVQGSDPKGGPEGAEVFHAPDPAAVDRVDALVYSSAISESHPELRRARERASEDAAFRVYHRMEFLKELTKDHEVRIGIAGTHGKTSTTSLTGFLLMELGFDPLIFAGGRPLYLREGMRAGKGPAVFETDESDGSFLQSGANLRLVLNVDRDHLDYYGSYEALQDAFVRFAREGQLSVVNGDDPVLKGQGAEFAVDAEAGCRGVFESDGDALTVFDRGVRIGTIELVLPGRHFAVNALGVFALLSLAMDRGILPVREKSAILDAMRRFPGVERRLERIGMCQGLPVYDDYGHHPSEIRAVLKALRLRHREKVRVVFEPHRYTRTRDLAAEFAEALSLADECWILPLYSAGESPIPGVDSGLIASRMSARLVTEAEVAEEMGREPVVWLFQGAGSISAAARRICGTKGLVV